MVTYFPKHYTKVRPFFAMLVPELNPGAFYALVIPPPITPNPSLPPDVRFCFFFFLEVNRCPVSIGNFGSLAAIYSYSVF